MKTLVTIITFLLFSLSSFSQKITLDDLLKINISELNEEYFQNNWIKKYGLTYLANSGRCYISNETRKLDENIRAIDFNLKSAPSVSIDFSIPKYDGKNNDKEWQALITGTYEDFLKKHGEPKDFSVKKDLTVVASWILNKQRLTLIAKTSKNNYHSNSSCTVILHKTDDVRKDTSQNLELPPVYFNKVRKSIGLISKNFTPVSNIESTTIYNKIKVIRPKTVNFKTAKYYYNSIAENSYPAINLLSLQFNLSHLYWSLNEGQPKKDGYYICSYFENDILQKVEKVKIENGKSQTVFHADYWYENGIAPKLIIIKHDFHQESYWFDYNNKGYISRVLHFRNGNFVLVSFYTSEDNYKETSCLEFNPEGELLSYFYSNKNISFKSSRYQTSIKSYNYINSSKVFTPENTPNNNKRMKLGRLNILPTNNFKPNRPLNHKIAVQAQEIFENFIQFKNNYLEQCQNIMRSQANLPKELFEIKEYSLCEVIKYTSNIFPLVLTQTGKGAIRVYAKDKKTYTLKLNQVYQNQYLLSEVALTSCIFKDTLTGKEVTLNLNKPLNLGKAAYIRQAGRIHKVSTGDNFFGYDVNFNDQSIVFTDGDIKIVPSKHWFALTPQSSKHNKHKLSKCDCYNDISFDKKQKSNNQKDQFKQILTAAAIQDAKESKIDLSHLLKYCAVTIDVYQRTKNFNEEFYEHNESAGSFIVSNKKLIPLTPLSKKYKVTYFGKNIRLNNNSFILKEKYNMSGYYTPLGIDKGASLKFTPRNSWTLSRIISDFSLTLKNEALYKNYYFKNKDVISLEKNIRRSEKFEYSIEPTKDELTIDGKVYKIEYRQNKIYIKSELDQSSHRLHEQVFIPLD